jgi:hypothetical protein
VAPTPTALFSAPASIIQQGPPAGCDDALTAINTNNQTAGSTTNSEANAALQACDSLLPDSTESNDQVISSDIADVAEDFYVMNQIQTEGLSQSYAGAVRQVNSDIQLLKTACGVSEQGPPHPPKQSHQTRKLLGWRDTSVSRSVITKGFILAKENTRISTKILRDHDPVSNVRSNGFG